MAHINRPIFDSAHDPRSGFGLRMFAVVLSLLFLLVAAGSAVSSEAPAAAVEPPPAAEAPQTPAGDDPPAARDDAEAGEETPRPFLRKQVRDLDAAVRDDAERFYQDRGYDLAWLDADGSAEGRAGELIDALDAAGLRGLDPADYGAAELRQRLASGPQGDRETDALDAALTGAFLRYAGDLLDGRLSPQEVEGTWHLEPRELDLAAVLTEAIDSGTGIAAALRAVEPQHQGYQQLVAALERYRGLADEGGWPQVPDGPLVEPGDAMEPARFRALVGRLEAEGFLPPEGATASLGKLEAGDASEAGDGGEEADEAAGPVFDDRLAKALRHFQDRHGIREDGKLGPNSQRELNVSAEQRAGSIALNLERWRWLPADLGERHVEVNLPGFTLRAVDHGRVVESMRVVVGKEGWETPVMSERMESVVVNPYWNVPESILRADVAPQVRENRGYLDEQNMEVVDLGSGRVLAAHAVDWSDPQGVRVRQRPGPDNSLGQIKFLFPNEFNVYLHDTPAQAAFDRTYRDESHGCVRVERPIELAGFVFDGDADWSAAEIEGAIASGERREIELDSTLPVHFLYWTAFVDDDGEVHFRPDLYEYDADHLRALEGGAA